MNFIESFDLHHHRFQKSKRLYPIFKKSLSVLLFALSIGLYTTSTTTEQEAIILDQQAKLVKSKAAHTIDAQAQDYYQQAYGVELTFDQ